VSDETPQQDPKRYKEGPEPSPEMSSPKAPEEEKGDATSCHDASKEPAGNEETRRVAEMLVESERGSQGNRHAQGAVRYEDACHHHHLRLAR
jgi:hypothetical protein